jgi:hypothetical protein
VYSLELLIIDGKTETCRVIFNKLEKIVHLVGFTIGIYHDARSHKRQIYITLQKSVIIIIIIIIISRGPPQEISSGDSEKKNKSHQNNSRNTAERLKAGKVAVERDDETGGRPKTLIFFKIIKCEKKPNEVLRSKYVNSIYLTLRIK